MNKSQDFSVSVINLPKNKTRRFFTRLQMGLEGVQYQVVDGVLYDPSNPEHNQFTKNGLMAYVKEECSEQRIKGVTGCWVAHANVINNIQEDSGQYTVILEDDFMFRKGFFDQLYKEIQKIDLDDFDLICIDPRGDGPLNEDHIQGNFFKPNGKTFPTYWGAHCIVINNKSKDKILNCLKSSEVHDIDGFYLGATGFKSLLLYTDNKSSLIYLGSDLLGKKLNGVNTIVAMVSLLAFRFFGLKSILYKRYVS